MRRIHALTIIAAALAANSTLAGQRQSQHLLLDADQWCTLAANEFSRTGIKVNAWFKGSGETFAQVKAEATNPKGNI